MGLKIFSTKTKTAFTLAELLIALAILGVIATFTIPKVLTSQQATKKKAVFRETLSALADITQQASRSGTGFLTFTDEQNFFKDRLNYVKRCSTDPVVEGCWRETGSGWGTAGNVDAYLLPNGSCITSLNFGSGTDRETVAIDWNCTNTSATVAADDLVGVLLCFGPNACSGGGNPISGNRPKNPGVLGPLAGNETTYDWIFAN